MSTAVNPLSSLEASTAAGIAKSRQSITAEFRQFMLNAIREVAKRQRQLTTDDVWEQAAKVVTLPTDINRSTIGPIMNDAVKDGIIRKVDGAALKSKQPQSHGRLLRVFMSNVHVAA